VTSGVGRFTFRGNLRQTRHGWLRLTPAYSLHLVRELAEARARPDLPVLDPFSGTGTTLLACAELGVACESVELNPFLVWLAKAKVARYDAAGLRAAESAMAEACARARAPRGEAWTPPLHAIDRWWGRPTLDALARAFAVLEARALPPRARDLCRLAFCRALVAVSSASFRHQSMSFAEPPALRPAAARTRVTDELAASLASIAAAAARPLPRAARRVHHGDARQVARVLGARRYGTVITSPPYANRMSYIRELRPYMYWLGYLRDGRAAGELDWRAIGGTWGAATSKLSRWEPAAGEASTFAALPRLVRRIARESDVLGRYVERYAVDMATHLRSLRAVVAEGGAIHYVVGNSKFFDVVVPIEELLATEMRAAGFSRPRIERLRKRTSKPELFEFRVSARG